MIQRKTRWELAAWDSTSSEQARRLSQALQVSPLVARLLVQRGCGEVESASIFLNGDAKHFHDPYLMKDMEAAVARIKEAAEKCERVRIYGDYDADGVSSTSLLVLVFRELGLSFDYYIPHRAKEGYGLNRRALELAREEGISLIVTVDTGISAYDEVEYAKELGIDMVVTDHHEPPDRIPDACAVVNPKRADCGYPFKGLAGVGVAFKLATALLHRPPLEWADVASLGTIADLMPLEDENRIIVRYGLKRMSEGKRTGFKALAEAAGIELEQITSTNVAFSMAPRINAAGRLDHAKRAVELLTTESYDEAILAAVGLDSLNKERQRIVDDMVKEAEKLWDARLHAAESEGKDAPAVILLGAEGWNVGVIGIVASKLLDRYYKPVIIFGIDEATGMCKGSARSIDGFDLHAALTVCEELLDHYGGHQAAAGMSLHRDRLSALEQRLSELASEWLSEEDWIPRTKIDLACTLEEATLETIAELSLMEPFGMGNPSPRVMIEGVPVADMRAIGKEGKHLKLTLGKSRGGLDAIGFSMGELASRLRAASAIDVIGELSVNVWNGHRKPQLQLHDLHAEPTVLSYFPTREQFGEVYQLLRRAGTVRWSGLCEKLGARCGMERDVIAFILEVFQELQFIEVSAGMVQVAAAPGKRDLATSSRYCSAQQRYMNKQASPV
ncbi:single-stranded-DNA-specific exonuclease RecJ [Paenibacillus sp. J5C_2022]|uniref:single-stranded-DNA-specific exonuclease RecJ n=1 Tax=Paenibacillus sp. J5C2022 TaxID=2977129 RepID=UPI0021D05EFD|nr:single-stranded-DNA-specific exonuclease RecJ [Paenibacillus sp. J5C2022]MCU6711128.1 single-stranded-DNA-specific exonuclease RecJ [Paenibacillus sp. J5C2022]